MLLIEQVWQLKDCGGELVVMPHADTAVIRAAKEAGLICTPGVVTPTEAFAEGESAPLLSLSFTGRLPRMGYLGASLFCGGAMFMLLALSRGRFNQPTRHTSLQEEACAGSSFRRKQYLSGLQAGLGQHQA